MIVGDAPNIGEMSEICQSLKLKHVVEVVYVDMHSYSTPPWSLIPGCYLFISPTNYTLEYSVIPVAYEWKYLSLTEPPYILK